MMNENVYAKLGRITNVNNRRPLSYTVRFDDTDVVIATHDQIGLAPRAAPPAPRAAAPPAPRRVIECRFNVGNRVLVTGRVVFINPRMNIEVNNKEGIISNVIPNDRGCMYDINFTDNTNAVNVKENLIRLIPVEPAAPRADCAICYVEKDFRIDAGENQVYILPCRHTYHRGCIEREMQRVDGLGLGQPYLCPSCRAPFAAGQIGPIFLG
jgi:hypothetical protein